MAPNKIFPLKRPFEEKLTLSLINDEFTLWHLRFRYLNFNSLKLLKQKEIVIGLPSIENERKICEGCIYIAGCTDCHFLPHLGVPRFL